MNWLATAILAGFLTREIIYTSRAREKGVVWTIYSALVASSLLIPLAAVLS